MHTLELVSEWMLPCLTPFHWVGGCTRDVEAGHMVWGVLVGSIVEKLYLYAYYALWYLADASSSPWAALAIIDHFGHFLGICINWDKYVLFLHPSVPLLTQVCSFTGWSSSSTWISESGGTTTIYLEKNSIHTQLHILEDSSFAPSLYFFLQYPDYHFSGCSFRSWTCFEKLLFILNILLHLTSLLKA